MLVFLYLLQCVMDQKYPQGMRKKPITLSNPDGSSRNFNSYAEALDYADNLKKTRTNYYRSPVGQVNPVNVKYDKEYSKAVRQGYKPTTKTDTMQDPVADKEQGLMNTISETNAAWMNRVANGNYRNQGNISKAMQVKNIKPGQ